MKTHGALQPSTVADRSSDRDPIAIIGIGCRLPGAITDWQSFWRVLETGHDCITETPSERWNLEKFYSKGKSVRGKTQSKWGGYVENIEQFDPELFGISPREAASMDPQQRLLLEASFRAIEDAGKRLDQLAGQSVAVFAGISSFDYAVAGLSFKDRGVIDAYSNTGGSSSIAANRISYCFDLRGPSVAVDTACSSSLVAVHLACESLWRGESEMALAGGVNALILPDFYVAFSQLGVMSQDGRCRMFDAKAAGYVRSEGAGVVLLKPLRSAVRDRDPIYAVIRGTALNQDGRTPGMTVPSQSAQESLIRSACRVAGVQPSDVQYVEAHGTGTSVGDPIEAAAIGAAIGKGREPASACWVGSVKTNIGHLESGAGAASLIKVALSMHHRKIPRNLHFHEPHPAIDLNALGLRVPTDTVPWEAQGPRLAGINGFGYGGTNAHVIVEQAPESIAAVFSIKPSASTLRRPAFDSLNQRRNTSASTTIEGHASGQSGDARVLLQGPLPPVLLPISARSPEALRQTASQLARWLSNDGANFHLAEIAGYLAHRRSHLDYRAAVCSPDHASMIDRLQTLATLQEPELASQISPQQVAKGPAFVCSGQGPQWWAMGRGLLKYSPVFRSVLKRCDAELSRYASWSLIEELEKSESQSRMHLTSIAQPSLFAIQVALAAVWDSWGVRPNAIVGHSVGEIAAAFLAGALNWEDACLVAYHRGRTMDLASSQGGMLAVGLTPHEIPNWIREIQSEVSVAAINGPASLTIAGAAGAIDHLQASLERANIFCRRLAVEYAFHSPQMEPVRDALLESLEKIRPQATHTQLFSTVTGQPIDGRELGPDYWWRNVRQTVRFADAMACLARENYGILIEIGPHPVLSYSISECFQAANQPVRCLSSLNKQQSDLQCISKSLGSLYSLGMNIHWSGFYNQPMRKLPVPVYPLQLQRLWNESLDSFLLRQVGDDHPLLGTKADHAQACWQQRIDLKLQDFYSDHKVRGSIIYPAAGIIETVIAAAKQIAIQSQETFNDMSEVRQSHESGVAPAASLRLERLKLHNPFILAEDSPNWMETNYQSSRNQLTMAFRSCRVPQPSVISADAQQARSPRESSVRISSETGEQPSQTHETSATGPLIRWTPLVTVSISGQPCSLPSSTEQLNRIRNAQSRCTQQFTQDRLYDYCERLGLQYGPRFRGVLRGCWRAGEAVADIRLPDSIDPSGYLLHPALLDSCFHVMIAADASFDHALDGLYLPAEIGELFVNTTLLENPSQFAPIRDVVVHARVLRKNRKKMWCDLDISMSDGNTILAIRGFESHRVLSPSTVEQTTDLIYGYTWQSDSNSDAEATFGAPSVSPAVQSQSVANARGSDIVNPNSGSDTLPNNETQPGVQKDILQSDNQQIEVSAKSCWLMFMDESGVGKELCQRLRAKGDAVIEVYQSNSHVPQVAGSQTFGAGFYQVNPEKISDFEELMKQLDCRCVTGIVYLWGLDVPENGLLTPENLQASTILTSVAPLYLVQAWSSIVEHHAEENSSVEHIGLASTGTRFFLITRGAQTELTKNHWQRANPAQGQTDPSMASEVCQVAQAPLIGIGRVIISEIRGLTSRLVDLPPIDHSESSASGDIDQLFYELRRQDEEDEVLLRGGNRWLHRFQPLADEPLSSLASRVHAVQLRSGNNSGIEELHYKTKARGNLAPGQVEIEVVAAGLNFSDVMKALDLYPGLTDSIVDLGAECSGRISRVASGSRWSVGEEVIAIAPGAFASHVIVNEQLVAKKPTTLTHEEAAAIPVAFLTSQYALHQCARLKRGESILIHAATGGVGLAAIQLASAAGLRILATAGSDEKRNYLNRLGISYVMDSRSLNFGQQTMEFTGGEGVDAILNSLPGEAITTGLRALKLGGRFLEIGKRDIYNDAALGLFPFRKNLSLFAIDLDQLFKHQPAQMGLLLRSLVQRFELGELRPLPTTVFDANDSASAFRFMQQSKHIGKVVVQYKSNPTKVFAGGFDPLSFRSDRSYWIAGGLGGFGVEVAKWMSERGARNLVLSGRSTQMRPEAQATVERLIGEGVKVLVQPTDITKSSSVQATLSVIDSQMPPLAGVLHTAMVLEDSLLVDLDREKLERVLWPKVLGGWNLHDVTRNRELDHFIIFSSLSSIFGHAGQANYSAANALLDSLAHYRKSMGLPAVVINWGHLGEVGYLAEREQLGQRLERQGVLSFTVKQAMNCLEYAIQTNATQLSVLRMDWSLWRGLGITGRISPRFAHLLRDAHQAGDASSSRVNHQHLRTFSEQQRQQVVAELLRTKIGSLLGMNPATVRDDRAPLEMGLDSLMAVELRNWIEAQLEVNLQISTLMRSNSLNELTTTLCDAISQSALPKSSSVPKTSEFGSDGLESPNSTFHYGSSSLERVDGDVKQFEKISSQEAAELLENLDQLSSHDVSDLLGRLL